LLRTPVAHPQGVIPNRGSSMSADHFEQTVGDQQAEHLHGFAAELVADGDRVIVTARGHLNLSTQPLWAATLAKAIATEQREVVIDLAGLESIDSEDVGLLVRARSLLQNRGKHLVVHPAWPNPEPIVSRPPGALLARMDD
jgi:anti-anti-sigma factor